MKKARRMSDPELVRTYQQLAKDTMKILFITGTAPEPQSSFLVAVNAELDRRNIVINPTRKKK